MRYDTLIYSFVINHPDCIFRNFLYIPSGFARSSLWLHVSIIAQASITMILSIFMMVESLCAMTIVVLFFMTSSIASWMSCSDSESSDEVASSSTRILLFSRIALAIATLCLSPHESFIPLSPTRVSYPYLSLVINS